MIRFSSAFFLPLVSVEGFQEMSCMSWGVACRPGDREAEVSTNLAISQPILNKTGRIRPCSKATHYELSIDVLGIQNGQETAEKRAVHSGLSVQYLHCT